MKRGIVIMLSLAFALVLGFAGCAGSGGTSSSAADPAAQSKEAFTGTWDLSSMDDNGEITTEEDIALLKSLDLDVYLQLDEDGTATLDLFGEKEVGTWEPGTATSAQVTLEDQTVDMQINDGKLTMEQSGAKLEFAKGEPRTGSDSN